MEMKKLYEYAKIIGIETTDDLKRFFKENRIGNEKPITTFRRYIAFLKRWGVVKCKI